MPRWKRFGVDEVSDADFYCALIAWAKLLAACASGRTIRHTAFAAPA
jgi:hypothetical protein